MKYDIEVLPVITTDLAAKTNFLYEQNGWGHDYQCELTARAWNQSAFRAVAVNDGLIVGAIRGFSDEVYVSWVTEILVDPQCQRKGVGARLLQEFTSRYGHTVIYAKELLEGIPFFEKNGMVIRPKLAVCAYKPDASA
ncbi:GNAT family N-acetyltransferase [Variovorax sp. GT1P44]|uniref:GNAT family N-acetyltransferase n=1 Tax=Variovorax sp. GT1P44 TaxID=3443742 RepID=UPI003F486FE7